jgi:hypothetical protein
MDTANPPALSRETAVLPPRFWAKVNKDGPLWNGTPCWLWSGTLRQRGYGYFWDGTRGVQAHRWAYEHLVGPIPAGQELHHSCGVHSCVNAAHLSVVTHQENTVADNGAAARNARVTHCPQGHPYDLFNTWWGKRSRYCKECTKARGRARS